MKVYVVGTDDSRPIGIFSSRESAYGYIVDHIVECEEEDLLCPEYYVEEHEVRT